MKHVKIPLLSISTYLGRNASFKNSHFHYRKFSIFQTCTHPNKKSLIYSLYNEYLVKDLNNKISSLNKKILKSSSIISKISKRYCTAEKGILFVMTANFWMYFLMDGLMSCASLSQPLKKACNASLDSDERLFGRHGAKTKIHVSPVMIYVKRLHKTKKQPIRLVSIYPSIYIYMSDGHAAPAWQDQV